MIESAIVLSIVGRRPIRSLIAVSAFLLHSLARGYPKLGLRGGARAFPVR